MAYPLAFTAFPWEDLPAEGTPLDKKDLQEAEERLAKFTVEFEVHWRKPVEKIGELYSPPNVEKGDTAFVEELKEVYYYTGAEWDPIQVALRYWKAPVAKEANLPTSGNAIGDVRLDLETKQFYICYHESGSVVEQWKLFTPTLSLHTHTTETLTWSVAEELMATPEIIPGGFRRLASEEEQKLYEIEFELAKGEAELELKISGTAVEFTGAITIIEVKTAAEALKVKTPFVFSAKDKIELVVHSVSEEPTGLAFSAFVEHITKAV